jgi:ATP-dependent Clp protease ATP-binding subunit ClpB
MHILSLKYQLTASDSDGVACGFCSYVGHEEGGQLTEQVRRRPYSVILFDEVEKAHVAVFNTLLQVLDDGRLTDGQGRTVDFRNTVIIMTSNIGAKHLLAGMVGNNSMKAARDLVMLEVCGKRIAPCIDVLFELLSSYILILSELIRLQVRKHFRPELLNRLDEIVIFDPLSHEQLRMVARLQVKEVAYRLAERGVALAVTDAALDLILSLSYDPVCEHININYFIVYRHTTLFFGTCYPHGF